MLVGLRLRHTLYDLLRFDSQSKDTGYNYYFFVERLERWSHFVDDAGHCNL